MTTLSPYSNLFAVQVPEGAHSFEIFDNGDGFFPAWIEPDTFTGGADLPEHGEYLAPGSYEILFQTKSATWGEKLSVLEKENDGSGLKGWWYKDYETGEGTKNIDEAFLSLLRSNSLDI